MRSRRGASTRTVVRSSVACAALAPRDVMRWAFQDLRGTRAASWTGTRLLSRARSTRTSGTAASAARVHGRRMRQGPIGSTRSTNSAGRKAGSRCERAVRAHWGGRSHRACAAVQHPCRSTGTGATKTAIADGTPQARRGTARRGCDRLGGDAPGSWSLPSHSRLGGDGEGAPAGGSAGGSKTELNSHSRYARATQPRLPRQSTA